jgi:hypothetical protein
MIRTVHFVLALGFLAMACREVPEATSPTPPLTDVQSQPGSHSPTWWNKYLFLAENGPLSGGAPAASTIFGNVDVSNECGPQSETYVTLNPRGPQQLTAGSNEIFRLPMRAYFSSNGGGSWGGVDVPLPPPLSGTNDTRFGSDPTLAFDTQGSVFYGFIVVFFSAAFNTPSNGVGINGTEMAVARSGDGGSTWPSLTQFSFEGGENHFNDKPMITVDQSSGSFRDNVYVAWDAASGGSTGGGIRVGRSTDHGASFTVNRADDPSGPGRSIGAVPFVGPDGTVYVAWNDYSANVIAFNRSLDGGVTWGAQRTIAPKVIPFDIGIPAEAVRRALVYPACDTDRSARGSHRGRLYCSWMDLNASGHTTILLSSSDDAGTTWSTPPAVVGQPPAGHDRFNHWISVDPVTGEVTVSYYDATGFTTDIFLSRSTDGGATWLADVRVTTQISNEHDCGGLFPCPSINYGNQQGDYEGLVTFRGVSHPIWTDSRRNTERSGDPTCGRGRGLMEEVFTASVKN